MAGMADTSSTAIDLSRLPAPAIVEQLSFEAILAVMLADLQARLGPDLFDALVESDPAMKLLEVCAYRELLIRQRVNDAARGVMLAYAAGADLDQLAALVGVARLTITPANEETGAAAVMESDEALRQRVILAPESFSVAGPGDAYVYHALSADAGVLAASCTSPEPGEIVVTILARDGDGEAGPELIEAVEAVVNSRPVRPQSDLVSVQSAEIVTFAVAAALTLYHGPDTSVVVDAAEASLTAYLNRSRKLGRDITVSGLTAALQVEGVHRVALAAPAADVVVTQLQAAFCTGADITVAGYTDD